MLNSYEFGELLYRLENPSIESDYFVITGFNRDLVYINPLFDLKSNWFVHKIDDIPKMYRRTTPTERILYGKKMDKT